MYQGVNVEGLEAYIVSGMKSDTELELHINLPSFLS